MTLLLAALFMASVAQADSNVISTSEQTNTPSRVIRRTDLDSRNPDSGIPPKPKPTPINSRELAQAFRKNSPTSIDDLKSMEQRLRGLVPRVSPAVVAVEVGDASGSGVIISNDGMVLTAGHVCGWPDRDVRFTFADGRTARGKTLGVDTDSDVGLMKITSPGSWATVPMGNAEDARVGDWVMALGHPGGFDLKRSLVVRLGRIILMEPGIVQTDCPISPGDSGGPLFDMYGRVIAIHSAISTSTAANFHVPVTAFYTGWNDLVNVGRNKVFAFRPSGYIGASVVDEAGGCRLDAIADNGPASKAGLKSGDVVVKIEGRDIFASAVFRRWLDESVPGDTLNLEVKRGDKLLNLAIKLQTQPLGK